VIGALLAAMAIFLPSLLLALAVLPTYRRWLAWPPAARAVAGLNAGVVGLLAAAAWTLGGRSIHHGGDAVIVMLAVISLVSGRVPVWAVVASTSILGWTVHVG